MYLQNANLDVIPSGVRPVIYCSQYDNQTNAVRFTLYRNGALFTIPNDCSVVVEGSKPDNTAFVYAAASWTGATVTINVTQQMTAVAGDVECELRVRSDAEIIGTLNFILRVEPAALSDDSVISETMIPLIEQAVDIAANLADYIQTAVDAAETATDAADTATTAASEASVYNSNVEGLYNSIETAKANANAAAQAANAAADVIEGMTAQATTLPAGSSATASYSNGVLTLGIPTGATGAAGASGVITELAGFFTMYVEDNGDLYVASQTDMSDAFEYDSATGALYYLTEDGEE